ADCDLNPGWEKKYNAGIDKCFYVNSRTGMVTDSPSVVSNKPLFFANPENIKAEEGDEETPVKEKKKQSILKGSSLMNIFSKGGN
ncbi:hypothetical protein SARC_17635, partial [Sphaeroforma arctica JP610]